MTDSLTEVGTGTLYRDSELKKLMFRVGSDPERYRRVATAIACCNLRTDAVASKLVIVYGLLWSVIWWFIIGCLRPDMSLPLRILLSLASPWLVFPYFAIVTAWWWYELFRYLTYRALLYKVRKRFGSMVDDLFNLKAALEEICDIIRGRDLASEIARLLPLVRLARNACVLRIIEEFDEQNGTRVKDVLFARFSEEMCREGGWI